MFFFFWGGAKETNHEPIMNDDMFGIRSMKGFLL
jgi:hypothetical protein